uniref:Sister chromatid cohesion 1 protein 4 isoform X1 n=1 Tax=Rhizophora mucronata TaxID=61149 RepID=A0A2P2MQ60_RHIMU
MFYSQFILAKKGPLGTIWIAAHLERKLRKNQVADTDIGVSVDSIIFPEAPIALRLSSHLLLGVVRIYSRKVNYLFDDCSEALLKVKQAFRSTAVDLPPEETTAPYHSITLPETFDLEDFELPESDIFQGNYVDHHVSTREQITLQDTMEGVVYSMSQFGLDERFVDGDTSHVGLELEEDLFVDKVTTARLDGDSEADPQAYIKQMTHPERHIEGLDARSELVDYAQAPCTPGLVEEPNLYNVQKVLASEDHLESEDHNSMELVGIESRENAFSKSNFYHANAATDLSSSSHLNGDAVTYLPAKESSYLSGDVEMSHSKLQRNLSPTVLTMECVLADGSIAALDGLKRAENVDNGGVCNNDSSTPIDKIIGESKEFIGFKLKENDVVEGSDAEVQAFQWAEDVETLNHHADNEQMMSTCVGVLQACDSQVSQPEGSSHEVVDCVLSPNLQSEHAVPLAFESSEKDIALHACSNSTKVQGEKWHITDSTESEENHMLRLTLCREAQADGGNLDGQLDNPTTSAGQFEMLNSPVICNLSAPEKLLSVPQMLLDKPDSLLVESTPAKEVSEGCGEGSSRMIISGKKRSFIASSLSVQSLNEVESYGVTRSKRTMDSIPDDDDLLSSILVGRRSSVLKMKPTPPAPAIASNKHVCFSSQHSSLKRKVLTDDSMVLHGDTICQQLINTEDIRRLRRKAPCTHDEILIIRRQSLEKDIFSEMVLTGMSAQLACLHRDSFDLSGITVSENDEHNTALGMAKDGECPARPILCGDDGTEGIIDPVNDGNGVDMQFADIPLECEDQCGDRDLGSYDVDKQGPINVIADVFKHVISECEPLGQMILMEIDGGNTEVADVPDHSVVGFEVSQTEPASGANCGMPTESVILSAFTDKTTDVDVSQQMDNTDFFPDKVHEPIDGVGDMDYYHGNKSADEAELLAVEESKISEPVEIEDNALVDGSTPATNADNSLARVFRNWHMH